MRTGLVILSALAFLALACRVPALIETVSPGPDFLDEAVAVAPGASISVDVSVISPLWTDLLTSGKAAAARRLPTSRALIGMNRASFTLYDAGDVPVDSWEVDVGGIYTQVSRQSPPRHTLPATWSAATPPFRLVAEVFNSAVSSVEPVVAGSATGLVITADKNTYAGITCLPFAPLALASGISEPRSLAPFVTSGDLVTVLGEEAWYSFTLTGERMLVELVPDADNTCTLAAAIYDSTGTTNSYNRTITATAAAPGSLLAILTPGTYYLGVAQSRNLSAAGPAGFSLRVVDGPPDPPAPTLTPGPGTVTVSWTSDPDVDSYTLYYGIPAPWDGTIYDSVSKVVEIPAIEGEINQTLNLPPIDTYGFWLAWKRGAAGATTPGMSWASMYSDARATGAAPQARALHVITEVNGWSCQAIGGVTDGSGSYAAGTGTYTLSGGGMLGLQGTPNPTWLQFLSAPLTGAFTLQGRVTSLAGLSGGSPLAGLGLRRDASPESEELLLGACLDLRDTQIIYPRSGDGLYISGPGATLAYVWFRISRAADDTVVAWRSDDGTIWTEIMPGTTKILAGPVLGGAFVISQNWSSPATATFDNFEVTVP